MSYASLPISPPFGDPEKCRNIVLLPRAVPHSILSVGEAWSESYRHCLVCGGQPGSGIPEHNGKCAVCDVVLLFLLLHHVRKPILLILSVAPTTFRI